MEHADIQQAGRPQVLVHCFGGRSRTGLVRRAWLMREQDMSFDDATTYVAERWPHLGLWNQSFDATCTTQFTRGRWACHEHIVQ
jgi:ADP-ribosyl-[dinitrogen reductase] hydrolase